MVGKPKSEKEKRATAELPKRPIPIQKLEEALHELGQKYISLLEHSRQGVILCQKDPPSLVWTNAAMAKQFGLGLRPIKSFPLQTLKTHLHPQDHKIFFGHYSDCLKGKPIPLSHPIRAIRKDRTPICLEYSFVRVDHLGQPAALGIFMDITDRKKLDETLQISQGEFDRCIAENGSELRNYIAKLKKNEEELKLQKEELSRVSQELWETNKAITILARTIDKNREEAELRVAQTISTKIMPIVASLKKERILERHRAELDILSVYLEDIIKGKERLLQITDSLSPNELRVATLVKNGLTNQGIAEELHVSIDTVKTHRRNIRKKLQIKDQKTKLSSFIKTCLP